MDPKHFWLPFQLLDFEMDQFWSLVGSSFDDGGGNIITILSMERGAKGRLELLIELGIEVFIMFNSDGGDRLGSGENRLEMMIGL